MDCGVSLTLPIGHLWHCNRPVSLPNSPGRQGRQEAWPSVSWKYPCGQSSQALGLFWSLSFSFTRYRPLAQSLHSTPETLLYCPAPHDVHLALPFESEDCPASHKEQFFEPATLLTLPGSHSVQLFMPEARPNSPGRHGRQNGLPGSLWYCPASQASHVNPLLLLRRPGPHWAQGSDTFSELLVQPTGQLKQKMAPTLLICPVGHSLQSLS